MLVEGVSALTLESANFIWLLTPLLYNLRNGLGLSHCYFPPGLLWVPDTQDASYRHSLGLFYQVDLHMLFHLGSIITGVHKDWHVGICVDKGIRDPAGQVPQANIRKTFSEQYGDGSDALPSRVCGTLVSVVHICTNNPSLLKMIIMDIRSYLIKLSKIIYPPLELWHMQITAFWWCTSSQTAPTKRELWPATCRKQIPGGRTRAVVEKIREGSSTWMVRRIRGDSSLHELSTERIPLTKGGLLFLLFS